MTDKPYAIRTLPNGDTERISLLTTPMLPQTEKDEALRLAYELDWRHQEVADCPEREAATELRRLHGLLGKANALCRIRQTRIKEDEALLRQAADMLAAMPVKHPQQGQERDALLEVIKERLK